MKKFAKVFMLIACVAMVFCFSAGAFASTNNSNSVTVTIDFQIVDRDDSPIFVYPITEAPLTVTANLNDTLYDVIVDANLGSTWDTVPLVEWDDESQSFVPTGGTGQTLTSLTLDDVPYENEGQYTGTNS